MRSDRLSSLARVDLAQIARFTQQTWGETQAQKYVRELLRTCTLITEHPGIGRQAEGPTGKKTMRFEHGSHVIFYRRQGDEVTVQRILHMRMSPR